MARWIFAVPEAIRFWRNHEIPYRGAEIKETEIAAECRQRRARALVTRFGLDPKLLNTTLFQRKVLDNMLMAKGGRWPGPGDSEDEAP
jgi:hypothetical protein